MTATSEGAAARAASIDALFAPWRGPGTPGAVVGVSLDGRSVHRAGYGLACLAHGVPLDGRSVIRIGSQTKQFCVLLALMLAAEGKLDLDDEVQRHAPWLPRFAHRVTLRHLVTNTSGLRDFLGLQPLCGMPLAAGSTRAESRAVIAAHPELNFVPGSELLYSNSGFFILSEILEAIADRSFDDLLQERICRPLGLRDTRLMTWDSAILPRLASHHTRGPDGAWHRAHWGLALGGEGGMVSTLDDLRVWLANLKHPAVGTPAMVAQLAARATLTNGRRSPYAHGLFVAPYRGAATIGHSGGVAGGRSESVRFPELDLDVVVLANCDVIPAFSMARRIADLCVGDRLQPVLAAPTLDGAAGFYREEGGEDVFALVGDDEAMQFQTTLGAVPFRAVGPDRFAPEKGAVDVELMARGRDGFDARWCGAARRYRRVVPAVGEPRGIVECWRATSGGIDAEIEADGSAMRLRLASQFGATRWPLLWMERDLLIADAGAGEPGFAPGRPWPFVVRVEADALVLSTERVRALRLRRA